MITSSVSSSCSTGACDVSCCVAYGEDGNDPSNLPLHSPQRCGMGRTWRSSGKSNDSRCETLLKLPVLLDCSSSDWSSSKLSRSSPDSSDSCSPDWQRLFKLGACPRLFQLDRRLPHRLDQTHKKKIHIVAMNCGKIEYVTQRTSGASVSHHRLLVMVLIGGVAAAH